jgi:hypothetical protein
MTRKDIIGLIGDILTGIDVLLSGPDVPVSSPEWQQLWALRKHLDDQQRELVAAQIDENTQGYATGTTKLGAANQQLTASLKDFTKIASTIQAVSTVAGLVDQLLKSV